MTKDKKALAKLAANAETAGLDPVLKRQIAMELHAGYAFNAKTAKYGVVTVWIPRLLSIGAGVFALGAFIIAIILMVSGNDITIGSLDPIRHHQWILYLAATGVLMAASLFFSFMTSAMKKAQSTAMAMAKQYQSDMSAG